MNPSSLWRVLAVTVLLLSPSTVLRAAPPPPKGSITIERIADVKYPTEQAWSPDGKTVAFLWDAAGKQDLYMSQGSGAPIALTDFPVDPDILTSNIAHFEWASSEEILFSTQGSLWTVSAKERKPMRLAGYQGVSIFSLSNDRKQIAFVRDGQIWVGNLEAKTQRQLTRISDGSRLGAPCFSLDNNYVGFSAAYFSDLPEPTPYNGNRLLAMRQRVWGLRLGIVSVFSGDPVMISTTEGSDGGSGPSAVKVQWAVGEMLVHQEFSPDRKTREIVETNPAGVSHTVWKDYDPLWFSPADGPRTVVSPDGKMIAFISDRTGWAHVYAIPAEAISEKEAKQLGKGDFGDGYANWSPDSKSIVYAHSEVGNQQERFLSIVDVASGAITPVVTERGVSRDAVFSPDGRKLAYLHSAGDHPQDVFLVDIAAAKPIRLSDSLPPGLNPADLTTPVAVHYPSRKDQKPVPATLIVNKDLDKSTRHPAIIWIHGSGADQNYLAWHPGSYRMYYGICEYFAQQGYVILTPDYRGSSGFSREWTTGAFNDLGGGETDDVNAGADYLKTLNYVDPNRIGVWGLSYGGFMTLQSIERAPKLFAAAIDVAGVGDWATYMTGNSAVLGRIGGTPTSDPDFFDRASPARHLDKIERPLLILQGTNDVNVPEWESLKVIDQLEKLGKPFDMAYFPGEIHFFRRAFVLRDAWRRSDEFFYKYLVEPTPMSNDATASDGINGAPSGAPVNGQ